MKIKNCVDLEPKFPLAFIIHEIIPNDFCETEGIIPDVAPFAT